jgi:hypothetical protein
MIHANNSLRSIQEMVLVIQGTLCGEELTLLGRIALLRQGELLRFEGDRVKALLSVRILKVLLEDGADSKLRCIGVEDEGFRHVNAFENW